MYLNNCTFIFKESYRSISVDVCFCLPVMESCRLGRKMEQLLWKEEFFFFFFRSALQWKTRASWWHWVPDALDWGSFWFWNVCFICVSLDSFHLHTLSCFYSSAYLLYTVTVLPRSLSPVKSGVVEDVYSHSLIRDCFLKASIVILNKLVFCHSCCNLWRKYWFESIKNY